MPKSSHDAASDVLFRRAVPEFMAGGPPQPEKEPNPFEELLRFALAQSVQARSSERIANALTSYIYHALGENAPQGRPSDIYATISIGISARIVAHHPVDVMMRYINEQLDPKS